MFYRIEASWDEKVTGIDDVQSGSAIYPVNIWDPIYINQWGHTLIPDYVVLPIPKIKTKANLTDLMTVFFTGSGGRLTISNRLKEILKKNSHGNIQFIPLTIYYKKKYLTSYWLTNIISFDNKLAINYTESLIFETHFITKIKIISINDYEDFKQNEIKLEWPNNLFIDKIVFKNKIDYNFCTIENVSAGVGYFVSEKLKEEIESAGCTGIEFQPIEQM
ncbi:MAG: hypothetical protein IM591_15310 [Chitinophagaceae bacterium]|jgi:hypothetical protein|nr:hypothetical protein [Chitinophagaceae bacterium]MCA6471745.1 hypothetical protein [Chitinophagaceae bacterium]MCA6492233.1 hypothetical protein [Chitinophagaceae bacterium]MCA6513356.1 hypothetical protein [Chitinophagaceae bacterium]